MYGKLDHSHFVGIGSISEGNIEVQLKVKTGWSFTNCQFLLTEKLFQILIETDVLLFHGLF